MNSTYSSYSSSTTAASGSPKMQLWFRHKLMIGSFLILVFSTIYGVYCLQTVRNLSAMVQLAVENAMTASTFTEKAKFDFARFDQEAGESLQSYQPGIRKYHRELAIQFALAAKTDIATVQNRSVSEDGQMRLKLALNKIDALKSRFEKMSDSPATTASLLGAGAPATGTVGAASVPTQTSPTPTASNVTSEWRGLSQRTEIYNLLGIVSIEATELGQSYRDEARSLAISAKQTIFSLIICTAGLIFGVVLLLLTTALPPLKILTDACGEIAKGKLFRRAEVKTKDEFGLLSHSFNTMIDRLEVKDRNLVSLLGAIPEAIFFFDRNGLLSKETSQSTLLWFKDFKTTPDIAAFFVRHLKEDFDKINKLIELIWSSKTKAEPETIFELLPSSAELELEGQPLHLRFRYRAQRGFNNELERVIVLVQDVSVEVLARDQRLAQENHVARILNLTTLGFGRCRKEFERQIDDLTQIAKAERNALASDNFKRFLHGFKGSLSVLGFVEVSEKIHHLETHIESNLIHDEFDRLWQECVALLRDQVEQLSKILKTSPDDEEVRVPKNKVEQLTVLAERLDDGELTTLLETFKSVDLAETLAKYRNYVKNLANTSVHRTDTVRLVASDDPGYESDDKAIELHINAGRIPLPPDIANQIDTIVGHLIRNAIDHGIEPKWERKAVGKNEIGAISIHAKLIPVADFGHQLELSLSDDGRGINVETLKSSAVKKGIWTDDEAEGASLQQAMSLIFMPAFSTKTGVDEVSGRGVGLDSVKSMIEKMGGGLGLQSKNGYGTRFKFQIPIPAAESKVRAGTATLPLPEAS